MCFSHLVLTFLEVEVLFCYYFFPVGHHNKDDIFVKVQIISQGEHR